MGRSILYMALALVLCSCHRNKQDLMDQMPPLYPPPVSAELNTGDGYRVNPVTGDSIDPVMKSAGDILITGRPVPVSGKVIDPRIAATAKKVHLEKSNKIGRVEKVPAKPVQPDIFILDKERLKTFTPGKDTSSMVLVNSSGDTVPTGVPIPVRGKPGKFSYPQSVRALPPRIRDNATENFRYLNVEEGMNGSTVMDIFEDSRGDIWFGTKSGGASRYDGNTFTHFTINQGLNSNHIRIIFEDSRGNIWFGTQYDGVTKYDGHTFTHFTEDEGLGASLINSIIEDQKGHLWFGTNPGGAIRYDGTTFTHFTIREGLHYYDDHLIRARWGNDLMQILEDSQGNLWFANNGGGLSMYNGISFTQYHSGEYRPIGPFTIGVLEDRNGSLWIATAFDGIKRLNGDTVAVFTTREGLSCVSCWAIAEDPHGNLWFTHWAGADMFDGRTIKSYDEEDGLSNNDIWPSFADSRGNLWFGTRGGGVNIYRGGSFRHFTVKDGLLSNSVYSLWEEELVGIWIDGLARFSEDTIVDFTEAFMKSKFVLNDHLGNGWAILDGPGISKFRNDTVTLFYKEQGLPVEGDINSMMEDSRGNLWMITAGFNGLCMYDGITFTHFTEREGLCSNKVNAIMEDSRGSLWIATEGRGVSKYDGKNLTHYTEKEGLSNNYVRSVMEDRHGNLWFGTLTGGISVFDGESYTYITQREGLSHNQVSSTLEDRDGNIWVATKRGLNCIVTDHQKEGFVGTNQPIVIHTFNEQDGLIGIDFSGGRPALADSHNRLWWGTDKDLSMLDLNNFSLPVDPPSHLKLTQLDINGQFTDYRQLPDSIASKIKFDSVSRFYNFPFNMETIFRHNHLTFHFSAIDWIAPHKIRYSYFIEGVDRSWNKPSREPVADYRNLPAGTHTLYVRAIGAAQKWSEPFEYTFTIRPPWWYSWYAYCVYGLIITGMILLYRRFLLRRAALRSAVEIERVEKEKVLELDQMKSRFFANISHEFRTPLTLILGPVEGLLKRKEKELILKQEEAGILHRNAKRLLQMINQILDISKLETGKVRLQVSEGNLTEFLKRIILSFLSMAESKNIEYKYVLQDHPGQIYFDQDKVEKIVTNLISNAFKFTPEGGEVTISMKYGPGSRDNPDFSEITIRDTGRGIPAEQVDRIFDRFYQVSSSDSRQYEGTGIGLSLVKELAVICKGEISVESEPGKGSIFKVILPVYREKFKDEEVIQPGQEPEDDTHLFEDIPEPIPDGYERKENQSPEHGTERTVILVVEDNPDLRKYISGNLDKEYLVIEAENGREGFEMAIEKIPDLIITDLMMPEMDGNEMCNKIRNDQRTSHIPVVMLTARADLKSKLKGLETGADDYLIKPFDSEELLVRVKNLIQQRKNLREKFRMEFTRLDPFTKEVVGMEDDFLSRVVESILEHLDEHDYGVKQLARDLRFSRSQLFRKIQSLTGYAPRDFIRNIRLKQAARMFQEGHRNITKVLYSVGFNTPSHFSQSFREFFGMNPSDYLKQSRKL